MADRIFVIDDEPGMCESLQRLLGDEGFSVDAFQSSTEAVNQLSESRVDLIITDIKMPDMDGLELLKRVKDHDDLIPVIMMTGYGSLDTAIDAIKSGAYDYLLKPVEFPQLQLAVGRALEKRKGEIARQKLLEELRLNNLILKRRIGELNALYEAGKSIGSSVNLDDLLRQILTLATAVTESEVGSIMLLDERREYLRIAAAIGLAPDIVSATKLPIGESIAGFVAQSGEPLFVKDVEADARFGRINRERYKTTSLLCTPLTIKGEVLGVINIANKAGETPFSEDDLRLLSTFASQAAVAVDDAYQFEKSRRRVQEFEILHELSEELPNLETLADFREVLVAKLRRVFPIDWAIWFTWNVPLSGLIPDGTVGTEMLPLTESGKIDLAHGELANLAVTDIEPATLPLDDPIRLAETIRAILQPRTDTYPEIGDAFLTVPIRRNGELAHLFVASADREQGYSTDDIGLARLVVSQAALLFEKEKTVTNATRLMTMGNMISEISHDLRKPLTAISGAIQVIEHKWPQILEESRLVKTAADEINRMNELVRELVDFSNPNKYETTRIDLRDLVSRAAELVESDLTKHKIQYESAFTPAPWEIMVNKNQVLEMLLNLFMNAIDAMPEGGTLRVTGKIDRPPHKEADYLALTVADTGVGIPREQLARIFDRYFTNKETGTGLGLVVVERVISAHGGTLHVDSVEGEGTSFSIFFPLTT